MDPKPVKHRESPKYPTRREAMAQGAVFLGLVATGGCSGQSGNQATDGDSQPISEDDRAQTRAVVAPLFEHGEGRGAVGCVVVSPPIFLSEEEALQIIKEELAGQGIELGKGQPLSGVATEPLSPWKPEISKQEDMEEETAIPVGVDAVDPRKRIAVQYVSSEDVSDFAKGMLFTSTVGEYDTKGLAGKLATAIRRQAQDPLYVGVFFDPLVPMDLGFDHAEFPGKRDEPPPTEDEMDAWFDRMHRTSEEKSKALLRQQVTDFLAWLKQKKAI